MNSPELFTLYNQLKQVLFKYINLPALSIFEYFFNHHSSLSQNLNSKNFSFEYSKLSKKDINFFGLFFITL